MKAVKGNATVLVSQYVTFDPKDPHKTSINDLTITSKSALVDGVLSSSWSELGYTLVGSAKVDITFNSATDMLTSAVAAISKQQEAVKAKAQAEITSLERRKQDLLAISNYAEVKP